MWERASVLTSPPVNRNRTTHIEPYARILRTSATERKAQHSIAQYHAISTTKQTHWRHATDTHKYIGNSMLSMCRTHKKRVDTKASTSIEIKTQSKRRNTEPIIIIHKYINFTSYQKRMYVVRTRYSSRKSILYAGKRHSIWIRSVMELSAFHYCIQMMEIKSTENEIDDGTWQKMLKTIRRPNRRKFIWRNTEHMPMLDVGCRGRVHLIVHFVHWIFILHVGRKQRNHNANYNIIVYKFDFMPDVCIYPFDEHNQSH